MVNVYCSKNLQNCLFLTCLLMYLLNVISILRYFINIVSTRKVLKSKNQGITALQAVSGTSVATSNEHNKYLLRVRSECCEDRDEWLEDRDCTGCSDADWHGGSAADCRGGCAAVWRELHGRGSYVKCSATDRDGTLGDSMSDESLRRFRAGASSEST